jgi:hypothetical protein
MTPKNVMVLGLVTVVAVGAAAYSLTSNPTAVTTSVSGAVFPGLIDKVNAVTKVMIEHRDKTLTIARGKDGWSMAEADGYPVAAKNAEKVVVQLADLNFYEMKTKKPELYDRLHVEDPTGKESEGRRIRLFDAEGKVLADLVAGRKRYNLVGARKEGLYIRKPDDPQSWLAAGELNVEVRPGEWLVEGIVDISEKDIARAVVRHPDGEVVEVSKPDPKARNFTLAGIPDGKMLKYETDPDNLAGVPDQLNLEDARKAGAIEFPDDQTIKATFETRDGLSLTLDAVSKDDSTWARFKAETMADAKPEAQKRAEEINKHVAGWVYKLPGFKATRLTRRVADMLKDKPAS